MPRKLVLFGFLIALALFLFFGAGPYVVGQPPILLFLGIGLVFVVFGFLRRDDCNEGTSYRKFTLVAGAVSFFIVLTPLQELDSSRTDNPQRMLVVGISALIMLTLLRRKLRLRVGVLKRVR